MENGYVLTRQLLDEGKEFTAVFAFSDTMAVGACRAIAEVGKRIPQDYSVAGFDGIELCSYYNPTPDDDPSADPGNCRRICPSSV